MRSNTENNTQHWERNNVHLALKVLPWPRSWLSSMSAAIERRRSTFRASRHNLHFHIFTMSSNRIRQIISFWMSCLIGKDLIEWLTVNPLSSQQPINQFQLFNGRNIVTAVSRRSIWNYSFHVSCQTLYSITCILDFLFSGASDKTSDRWSEKWLPLKMGNRRAWYW